MATQPPPEAVCVSVQGKIFQSAACWASLQLGCASILKTSMHHCSCTQQDFGVWSLLGPSLPPHTSVLPLKELVILGCVCPTGTAPLELSIFERGWKVGGHSPEFSELNANLAKFKNKPLKSWSLKHHHQQSKNLPYRTNSNNYLGLLQWGHRFGVTDP